MYVFELKRGYPIYHLENSGVYGCKNDIIDNIRYMDNGFVEIKFINRANNTKGTHYAHPTEIVELYVYEPSKFKMFITKIKAFIYRVIK